MDSGWPRLGSGLNISNGTTFHIHSLLCISLNTYIGKTKRKYEIPPSKTITSSHLFIRMPCRPTCRFFPVQQCYLLGDPCLSLNTSFFFVFFFLFYLLTKLTLFFACTNSFISVYFLTQQKQKFQPLFSTFISATHHQHLVYRNQSDVPFGGVTTYL